MEKTKISAIGGLAAIFTALLWLLPSAVEAKGELDCKKDSLQAAIDLAKPGDVITVKGTCKENLVIPEEVHSITLDGKGKAKIDGGKDNTTNTVTIRGRGITITGFTITGGRTGISLDGGNATIDDNTIQNTGAHGVVVGLNGSAKIVNNTIQNNPENGIFVTQSSFARIGVLFQSDTVASPNMILNNGSNGIFVRRSSSAVIVGNDISGNNDGVDVNRVSHASIASNTIDSNVRRGIVVSENSGVDLGSDSADPETIFTLPNSTTGGSKNGERGLVCRRNSYVDGRVGTLNGDDGDRFIGGNCDNSLAD